MAQDPFGRNDSYTKVLGAKTRISALVVGLSVACGPKEAADPHEVLAEEYERAGDDQRAPAADKPDPGLAPATRGECDAATRRLFALGGIDQPDAQTLRSRVDECIARGTSRREARCVAQATSERAVDQCPD